MIRSQVPDNRKLVYILGLAGLISAADNWIVSPVLPAIAAGFGASISQAGAVLTAYDSLWCDAAGLWIHK